jgi:Mg-chelatase subunit ChlD
MSRRSWIMGGLATAAAVVLAGSLVTGHATLSIPAGQDAGPEFRAATLRAVPAPTRPMPADPGQWHGCVPSQPVPSYAGLDLVIAVDTTGSMGRVIADVKSNLLRLEQTLSAAAGDVRLGIVAYRDVGDSYVVTTLPLTPLDAAGEGEISRFIGGLTASGGGDWPEAMDQAIAAAAGMEWRGTVPASIVVIADAPPHPGDEAAARDTAAAFAARFSGAQVSLVDTGSGGNAVMRALPGQAQGQYITYDGNILTSLFPAITGCAAQ